MSKELATTYNPQETEPRIYKLWEESGFFNPDNLPERHQTPFCIIMPPPNANGHLHAGHALFITLQDIMIRYKRMRGFKALWVPGADHAGFETQIVYEKKLEKEGRSRFDMEPKRLFDEIMAFTLENKKYMEAEVRGLGASCDWSREKFTLDADVVRKVREVFVKMFNDGLIYRGKRPVNWCTKHQTSLSDVETESQERDDTLYYLKYGPLTVATVRPETMFGDVAVAVNPHDKRYQSLIGQEIEAQTPIGGMKLQVIGDEAVDPEFGTGALKITPAHDTNDFAIAQRHNLPSVEVIDRYGKLTAKTGKYAGMKISVARELVVEDLTKLGLIVKTAAYKHIVPVCYKCGTVIEPRVMDQWFVKMEPLAQTALEAVHSGKIRFIPDRFEKVFSYWMTHTIDWNISRQIVWGITIPAAICDHCGRGWPDLPGKIKRCPDCDGATRPDSDTFDTWFSSGQWPLLALGFPDGRDLATYYPTDVMETGYDLVFKWIPRMVIFGLYLAQDVPFETVYLHGLVNDAQGRKMSKSKDNVINPLELTAKYGTDALRMALVVGNTPGTDLALSEDKIKGYKHFANKLWNITRFVLLNLDGLDQDATLRPNDQAHLDHLAEVAAEVTDDMERFNFYLAAEKIYHYAWHEFADKIIEESKADLAGTEPAQRASTQRMLFEILSAILKLLHPFMPFLTEELYAQLAIPEKSLLLVENWPTSSAAPVLE